MYRCMCLHAPTNETDEKCTFACAERVSGYICLLQREVFVIQGVRERVLSLVLVYEHINP